MKSDKSFSQPFPHLTNLMKSGKNNLLIYRLGSLGDTIIALPCFHKIRQCFLESEITVLTNRPVLKKAAPLEAVLGKNYFYDRVISYPLSTRNPFYLLNIIKEIRSLKINTIINLTAPRSKISTLRDKLFFRAAGIQTFIAFPSKEDYKPSIDHSTGYSQWEAKRLANRLRQIGDIDLDSDEYWDLRLTAEEIASADELLAEISELPIIAISLGTKVQANDWGIDNWIDLSRKLSKIVAGSRLVILGSDQEAKQANLCLEAFNNHGLNLCGKCSPRVSAAILKKAIVFIGHDSGPMHLAACVGTPCVGIFSARNLPGQWFPRGISNQIIYHRTDCAGCGLEVCIQQGKKCILSITVEEAFQAAIKVMDIAELVKS